jgi:hypothetical protein
VKIHVIRFLAIKTVGATIIVKKNLHLYLERNSFHISELMRQKYSALNQVNIRLLVDVVEYLEVAVLRQ